MAASKDKTAADFLNDAAKIMEERGKQYDKPNGERSMGRCVTAFNAITGQDLTESEGWLLLQLLKDVRQWRRPGFHQDSAEDCVAYAALKAEAKQREAGEGDLGMAVSGAINFEGQADGFMQFDPAQHKKYSQLVSWLESGQCISGETAPG